MWSRFREIIGEKINKLIVLEETVNINCKRKGVEHYKCLCECGKECIVRRDRLLSKKAICCGCWRDNVNRKKKYSPKEATAIRVWQCRYDDGPFELFYKLSQQDCFYCGANPSNYQNGAIYDKKASKYKIENGGFIYNGMDRIDSTKGHIEGNVVPCCKYCNYAKGNMTIEQFVEWLEKLYNNLNEIRITRMPYSYFEEIS